jgi:hypothetical protein
VNALGVVGVTTTEFMITKPRFGWPTCRLIAKIEADPRRAALTTQPQAVPKHQQPARHVPHYNVHEV